MTAPAATPWHPIATRTRGQSDAWTPWPNARIAIDAARAMEAAGQIVTRVRGERLEVWEAREV